MPCHCGLDTLLPAVGTGDWDDGWCVLFFRWLRLELGDVALPTELSVGVGIVEPGFVSIAFVLYAFNSVCSSRILAFNFSISLVVDGYLQLMTSSARRRLTSSLAAASWARRRPCVYSPHPSPCKLYMDGHCRI